MINADMMRQLNQENLYGYKRQNADDVLYDIGHKVQHRNATCYKMPLDTPEYICDSLELRGFHLRRITEYGGRQGYILVTWP